MCVCRGAAGYSTGADVTRDRTGAGELLAHRYRRSSTFLPPDFPWHDAERRRRREEQGAHPVGAPPERERRETPAGAGDLLRHRAACHILRPGPAERHVAALRVRPAVSVQVGAAASGALRHHNGLVFE